MAKIKKKRYKNGAYGSWDWWRRFELWKPENNPYAKFGMPTLPMSPLVSYDLDGLDKGIARLVHVLRYHGIETCQSCEGGEGHSCPEPTVDFDGRDGELYRALGIAITYGFKVKEVCTVWSVEKGIITETCGRIILWKKDGAESETIRPVTRKKH